MVVQENFAGGRALLSQSRQRRMQEPSTGVSVLVFSKDRAFQLHEFLRSFFVHSGTSISLAQEDLSPVHSPVLPVSVTVLYTTSPGSCFDSSYALVRARFPHVVFWEETDFSAQLVHWLGEAHPHVLFAVDDIIVYRPLPLAEAVRVLTTQETFAVHLKLSPAITYCHTSDCLVTVPPLYRVRHRTKSEHRDSKHGSRHVGVGHGGDLLLFDRKTGTGDWNYPWDLCCSMYRRVDALAVLQLIDHEFGPGHYGHPNHLEANGHRALTRSVARSEQRRREGSTMGPNKDPVGHPEVSMQHGTALEVAAPEAPHPL